MRMWRIIKQSINPATALLLALALFLAGMPSTSVVEYVKDHLADSNVVDTLYLAMKDPNVIDRGLGELMRPKVDTAHAATFSIQTGYYIGNATDNRAITGLGFSPDLVLLKDNTAAGSDGVLWRSSNMTGERTAKFEAEADLTTNVIQSLDADGFTLGSSADVNSSNIMHYWIAFDGSDCSSNGTFCVGSYTGNGTSQAVTSVGFQPDLVIVKRSGASAAVWRSSSMGANTSNYFVATNQDTGGQMIQSLNATGFTVGNNATVNGSGNTYWYIAFKQVPGAMDVGTYTGDATDNRNITSSDDAGLTFEPDFVFVKNANAATAVTACFNSTENYGDWSFFPTDTASASNCIQDLRPSGGFEVGTLSNANGSGNTHYYAAFGGAVPKAAGSGTFTMMNGSYTGNGTGLSVTDLGFTPDLVIIKHHDQATDQYAVWRSSVMVGDITQYFGNAATTFTGGITALGTDGFTVGSHASVNTLSDTYYWTAFGNAMEPDRAGGSSDFLVGAYIGDGQDNTNVRHLSLQPDFVAVKRAGATAGVWRTGSQSGDNSLFFAATAQTTNNIQALGSDGFQKGTAANVNTAGNTYHYFMFKNGARFSRGTYTGTGSSQSVTSVGFQPDLLWLKKITGGTARAGVLRTSAQSGNTAQPFLNVATIANAITNLLASGFTVNTAVEANENTFGYQYAAWDAKRYTQAAYRFFTNVDSADVGAALAAVNTPAALTSAGDAFRLRLLARVDGAGLFSSGQNLKLQFVGKGVGTCVAPSGGSPASYTDVTNATAIAYQNNATPADGAALVANANDPTDGGRTIVNQTYEEANNLTNAQGAINNGQDGKWDFALKDNGAANETTFCFRLVKADGTPLDTYTAYPTITTAAAASQSLTFSISDNTIGFGTLSSSGARYATGDTNGASSDTANAHTLSASTNAAGGYAITVRGTTLTCVACGNATVNAIGATATASSPGSEQFGLRLVTSSGTGAAVAPYNGANWALDTAAFPDQVASGAGDGVTSVFGVRYIGNITAATEAGNYNTTLTYTATANF